MSPSFAFFCLCMVVLYSSAEKTTKTKRDVSGLYPFPRVGRAEAAWNSQYLGPHEIKRQGLIPFPRVGRNRNEDNSGRKRDITENGGGMWFGPRLGRLQKRNYLDEDNWALVQVKDLPFPGERKENLTPWFQRESTEDSDQNKDYHT